MCIAHCAICLFLLILSFGHMWDDLSGAKTSHDRSDCNGIVASEEQCMAGWTFRPVVKWQSGAGGSSQGSIPSAWESSREQGWLGRRRRGSGNSNESPAKRRPQPRWAGGQYLPCPPGRPDFEGGGGWVDLATVGSKSQRATRPHSEQRQPPSTKQFFFLETFIWA